MHKRGFLMLLLSVIVLLLAGPAWAEDLYMCSTGDGSAPTDGTCGNAFAESHFNSSGNWGVGANKISAGDTVYFLDTGGNFSGSLFTRGNGSSGLPITLIAYPGDTPVIYNSDSGNPTFVVGHQWITLDGLTIQVSQSPRFGVRFDAPNNIIQNCVVRDTAASGIMVLVDNITVQNNFIYDCGTDADLDHGIYVSSEYEEVTGLVLQYNYFLDNKAFGIQLQGDGDDVTSPVVRYNYTESNGTMVSTTAHGGGMTIWGQSGGGTVSGQIYGNISYNDTRGFYVGGVLQTSNNLMYNNTIYSFTKHGIVLDSGGSGNQVKNNIIWADDEIGTELSGGFVTATNCLQGSACSPSFVDTGSGSDFSLQSGDTAAKDQGTDLGTQNGLTGVTKSDWPAAAGGGNISSADLVDRGDDWDIGAYEYSSAAVVAPVLLGVGGNIGKN